MNRRDHRTSSGLPQLGGAWEVEIVPSPFEVEGVELIGLILVAEAESGLIRLAAPLTHPDEIRDQLIRACREPVSGGRPGRPASLRCVDPELMERLHDVCRMLDIALVEVDALPAIHEAEEALRSASGFPAPGLTEDLDAWREVLTELAELAPWRSLHEDTLFTFRGGPLDEAVAQVIGRGGEALGIVLYDSEQDYERFVRFSMSASDISSLPSVGCLSIHFERREELTDSDVAACEQLGLVLPGERYPRAFALEGGEAGPCSPEEQRALLGAVEGITAICLQHLSSIVGGEARTLALTCSTGWSLEITATPAPATVELFPNLIDADHAVLCGSIEDRESRVRHPCLVFKLRKPDALKLARQCSEIVAIELYGDPTSGLAVVACDPDGPLGQLVAYPAGPEANAIGRHLASQRTMYLAVSSGGPKRPGIHPEDFVYAEPLQIRGRDRWF